MTDVELVIKFGKENNWPGLVLVRNGNDVIKKMNSGKSSYKNAITWAKLKPPYDDNWKDVVRAVNEIDIWRENT